MRKKHEIASDFYCFLKLMSEKFHKTSFQAFDLTSESRNKTPKGSETSIKFYQRSKKKRSDGKSFEKRQN